MSEPRPDGGPAFPVTVGDGKLDCAMTLRDWFAGQALTGLLANASALEHGFTVDGGKQMTTVELAYYTADAMLAARDK